MRSKIDENKKKAIKQARLDKLQHDVLIGRAMKAAGIGQLPTPGQEAALLRRYVAALDDLIAQMGQEFGAAAADAIRSLEVEKMMAIRAIAKALQASIKPDKIPRLR